MKNLKSLALAVSLGLLSTAAAAESFNLKNLTSSSTVLTLHVFSNHPFRAAGFAEAFGGTSTTEPCSDLHSITVSPVAFANFGDSLVKISSDQLMVVGQALTCVKIDMTLVASGHVYSTGNIQLAWDQDAQAYTSATPDMITLDFSKE
jgi:hypothetical protein